MANIKRKISFKIKHIKQLIRKRRLNSFGKYAIGIAVNTKNGIMICDPQDGHVSRQLIKSGQYNPNEIKEISNYINSESKVLIVGGHIGALAIPLAHISQKMTIIEANPVNYKFLKANTLLSNNKNIKIHNIAACEQEKEIELILSKENSGGSKIKPASQNIDFYYDNPSVSKVKGEALDEFLEDNFDLVIMDIEGSEHAALIGAERIINSTQTLIIEYIPKHVTDVAGIDIESFSSQLIKFNFNHVKFPRHGIEGNPSEILKNTLIQIQQLGEYEDGIIFTRQP